MNQDEHVRVGQTDDRGSSLFAEHALARGDFIFLIAGPIIADPTQYTCPVAPTLFIDPEPVGNHLRYLNHSCSPNAGIKNRTMVVALRDIKPGDEVCIDYAMIVDEYGDEITEVELVCKCGSAECRGRLGSYNSLPQDLRQKYQGYISEWILEL